jgi:hypothetical protein
MNTPEPHPEEPGQGDPPEQEPERQDEEEGEKEALDAIATAQLLPGLQQALDVD